MRVGRTDFNVEEGAELDLIRWVVQTMDSRLRLEKREMTGQ